MPSKELLESVGQYIDKYYVPERDDITMDNQMRSIFDKISSFRKKKAEADAKECVEAPDFEIDEDAVEQFDVSTMQKTKVYNTMAATMPTNRSIDDLVNQMEETFSQRLLRMIDERGIEWEYDTYIMPTEDYVYMIWFGEKLGISPAMIRYEKEFISQIRNTKKLHKNQTLVFENAEDFEIRLNQGENLDGAIVTFEIKKVCPEINLVFGGYNLWGGEHLNFVSKSPMDVNQGDLFTVRVLYTTKTIGDSWVVHYVPLGDSNDEIEWAACDVEDIAEIVRKCRE